MWKFYFCLLSHLTFIVALKLSQYTIYRFQYPYMYDSHLWYYVFISLIFFSLVVVVVDVVVANIYLIQ